MTDTTTKERLMDAAERLFGERGYDDVSVRDLATAAEVNVAAVNYHFQGKENLYHEVIRRRFSVQRDATLASLQAAMPADGSHPELDAIIRAIVTTYLSGALASGGGDRIMAAIDREMHGGCDNRHFVVFKTMIVPVFGAFSAAMLQARPNLQQDDVNWLIASIVGQIHHFIARRLKADSLPDGIEMRGFMFKSFPILAAPVDEYVADVTDHIVRFSTAAIDGMHPEVTP